MRILLKALTYGGLAAAATLFGLSVLTARQDLGTNGALCFGCLVAIGLLAARDISHLLADRAVDFVFNDDGGTGLKAPEYEQAEEVWKSGDFLEAIRLLRAYYEKYPREVHVALRIAEIYEDNLGNHLAAALEYEEVLKKPLNRERWGWRAIHLCNLYNKINKPEKANELLQKIATDYSETSAAKKAREKLGWPEPKVEEAPPAPAASEPVPEAPKPNLPPGFRPKQ